MPCGHPLLGELSDESTASSTNGRGSKQGRREETDDEPDAASDLGALASRVVASLLNADLAGIVPGDEDYTLGRDRPLLDQFQEGIEVMLGWGRTRIDGNDDV